MSQLGPMFKMSDTHDWRRFSLLVDFQMFKLARRNYFGEYAVFEFT